MLSTKWPKQDEQFLLTDGYDTNMWENYNMEYCLYSHILIFLGFEKKKMLMSLTKWLNLEDIVDKFKSSDMAALARDDI